MRLLDLSLTQFRAHSSTSVAAAPGVNLFVGPNGAGKTNLLEALGYLGMGKSFLGASDANVVQNGADHFSVEGRFGSEGRADVRLRLAAVPREGKRASVNASPLDTLSSLVGRVPMVVLSPADRDLTAGGPSERRRFLDTTLSQAYPAYLDDLLRYRRALRQKNAALLHVRRGRSLASGTLDAWDEEIAVLGSRIMDRRAGFLDSFVSFVNRAHDLLDEPGLRPHHHYRPSVDTDGSDAGALDSLRQSLASTRTRSSQLGRTLVGPHLDEVEFRLGDLDLRPYASQGQHRTFALTIRVAQALFFAEHTGETPILLLDDVFGPLDPDRTRVVLSLLASRALGQSFVTAARAEPFLEGVAFESDEHQAFHVERGAVAPLDLPITPSHP